MNRTNQINSFTLKFTGALCQQNKVPVMELSNSLNGLQRTVHLLAMEYENFDVRMRERINSKVEQKYPILCSPIKEGSVLVNIVIGNDEEDLLSPQDIEEVSSKFVECINAIKEKNFLKLSQCVRDKVRRAKVIESIRSIMPKNGKGIFLELFDCLNRCLFDSETMNSAISEIFPISKGEELIQTVTGKLSKINFEERKITLIHPSLNKELECIYEESVEDMLLQHPRDYIQVTGRVILDDHKNPERITDVDSIQELDLSPFILSKLKYKEKYLIFDKNIHLEPTLDETKQLICLYDKKLGIDIYAYTRDELNSELSDHIDFLWREYANGDQSQMTSAACELSQYLRDAIREEVIYAER